MLFKGILFFLLMFGFFFFFFFFFFLRLKKKKQEEIRLYAIAFLGTTSIKVLLAENYENSPKPQNIAKYSSSRGNDIFCTMR